MECYISKAELLKGLSHCISVVDRKATMPILANVCLQVFESSLQMTATDLEIGIISDHPATVKKIGALTVSAKALFDIVKELASDTITLKSTEQQWLSVTAGKSKFKVAALSADEFPKLPDRAGGQRWELPVADFLSMVSKTAFAMSTDETRYNLNGVFLESVEEGENNMLRMVATDGHRLAYTQRPLSGAQSLAQGALVPRKGIQEWKRLLDGSEEKFNLVIDTKHVLVEQGNMSLMIRLIDGQFPPYQKVIPAECKWVLTADRQELIQALRRAQLVTTDRARGVKWQLAKESLTITAQNPNIGEAVEEVAVRYDGDPIEIGFNARYVSDVLSVVPDETVVLEFKGEMGPVVVRSEIDRNFLAVVMPMRL